MPHTRIPRRHTPLALLIHHPLQLQITRPTLPRNPAILHLREVALKEINLVLTIHTRRVGPIAHHAEMVVDFALIDSRGGLWDQLDASHGLAIPVGGAVEGEFGALLGDGVGGVFVGGGEGDVFVDGFGAVDIILVGPDFVAP